MNEYTTVRESSGGTGSRQRPRVLQVATVDMAIRNLLLPLMRDMRSSGYDVECAAADLGNGAVDDIRAEGFIFHDIDISRNLTPRNLLRGFRSIRSLLSDGAFDSVHFHTPVASFVGRLAARLEGQENIFCTAHGFYFHENMPFLKRKIFETAEWIAGRSSTDFLFCQSMEDADTAVARRFLTPSRVLHIGNGIDIDLFRPDFDSYSDIRKDLGLSGDSVIISFIGRIVREKGVLDLAKAFLEVAQQHPRAVLLFTGDCSSAGDRDVSAPERLRALVRMNGMEDRIRFLGFRDDAHRILAASDIYVLPSYREGLPRSICEAMSCGLPVIATRIRGCREQVDEGSNGLLFEPGRWKDLAAHLDGLLSGRGSRMEMGKRAREKATSDFDERDVTARQITVFKSLLPAPETSVKDAGSDLKKSRAGSAPLPV